MTEPNAFFVRLRYIFWGGNYELYVPGKFSLGFFNKNNEGTFHLDAKNIVYRESVGNLSYYERDIKNGKLKVVQSLCLPKECLEELVSDIVTHLDSRARLEVSLPLIQSRFSVQNLKYYVQET